MQQDERPLSGFKIVEFAGIGPGPFCAMLLAELGADVLRIDRPNRPAPTRHDYLNRRHRCLTLDLKTSAARDVALRIVASSNALIEGFRPGVMEKLGLGPEVCLGRNPGLVYGRLTGWGQQGPLSMTAGHDINYIALSGALHAIGEAGGPPVPPLNLVGDFAGGSLYLALGITAALLRVARSGRGTVIDAAMVDGAASLMTMLYGFAAEGRWSDDRGRNRLDGGFPWYAVYETLDSKFVAIGASEDNFYDELLRHMSLADMPDRKRPENWPAIRQRFADTFKTRTRQQWCDMLEGTDACFSPVLSLAEAPHHPHNLARRTFLREDGVMRPGPAPRFSQAEERSSPVVADTSWDESSLRFWGLKTEDLNVASPSR